MATRSAPVEPVAHHLALATAVRTVLASPGVSDEDLQGVLRRVVAPLIEADDGELYLVPTSAPTIHLHLRGRFSGCPGNGLVTEHVLGPVIRQAQPSAKIQVTSGALLPEGAERVRADA